MIAPNSSKLSSPHKLTPCSPSPLSAPGEGAIEWPFPTVLASISSAASGLRTSKHRSAQTSYSTSGADMLRRMCPNATQNCSRTANFGSSGQRKSARDSPYQSPQVAYVAYLFHSEKSVRFFENLADERGFEPPASSLRTGNH